MATSKPEQFKTLNIELFGPEIFGPQKPDDGAHVKCIPHENAQLNVVQIYIDPKTVELSAALHSILNATMVAANRFPNTNIKSIDIGSDYVRVETTGNESITMPAITRHGNY